jgi:hypothetical protein
MRLNRNIGRRVRDTLVLGLLLTACADAEASTSRVLPLPTVMPTQGEAQQGRHRVLFIRSLLVREVHGKLTVDCYGCQRFKNFPNVVVWRQVGTSKSFYDLRWLLRPGRGMIIKVVGRREDTVGRYRRLRVERRDGALQLVTSKTGCLDGRGRRRGCPSGVKSPPPGTPVSSVGLDGTPAQSRPIQSPPAPASSPAAPATNQVTIDPPPNNSVQACHNFTGTAELAPGNTLVLAVRNLNNTDPLTYFMRVVKWSSGTVGTGAWQAQQFFGSDDSSVGQTMELSVLVMSETAVARELAAHGAPPGQWDWHDPRAVPPDAERAKVLFLDRIPGQGCA